MISPWPHTLTELAGWGCFPAELFDPGVECHLVASILLLAEAFEVKLSSPFKQFGMHFDVRHERMHGDLLLLRRGASPP